MPSVSKASVPSAHFSKRRSAGRLRGIASWPGKKKKKAGNSRVSHITFFVTDQQKAYQFYVEKLGFNVNTDVKMENGFRWLTVTPPDQPDLEIALLNPREGDMNYDPETRAAFKVLLEKGALGAGVLHTPDCRDLRQSFVPRFSSVVPFAPLGYPLRRPRQLVQHYAA